MCFNSKFHRFTAAIRLFNQQLSFPLLCDNEMKLRSRNHLIVIYGEPTQSAHKFSQKSLKS